MNLHPISCSWVSGAGTWLDHERGKASGALLSVSGRGGDVIGCRDHFGLGTTGLWVSTRFLWGSSGWLSGFCFRLRGRVRLAGARQHQASKQQNSSSTTELG